MVAGRKALHPKCHFDPTLGADTVLRCKTLIKFKAKYKIKCWPICECRIGLSLIMKQWGWKDTIDRIQYIDGIIDQIIRESLVIDGAIFTLIPAFQVFLKPGNPTLNHFIMIVVV